MRLTEEERQIIKKAVQEVYGPTAVVRLFGSRVHDHLRGGDIDLHVEVTAPSDSPDRKGALWLTLQDALGEQRIDIIESLNSVERRPIEAIAYRDGLVL